MARMTRSQRRDDTRERLIDAARAVFASHGYTAATVAQISDGAGFTSGAFYSNFPSKNALAREIASHDIEFDTSQVAPDALGIALATSADNRVGERLWALGPLTKGRYWEITAVPDISKQAAAVADDVERELEA